MKKHLLMLAAAATALCSINAAEPTTTVFAVKADTWVRQDSPGSNNATADKVEMRVLEKKENDAVVGYNQFVGLMGFDFSVPAGMKVDKATLTFVTERVKVADVYLYGYPEFAENTTWNDQAANLEAAFAKNYDLKFTPAGQMNKAIFDGLNDENKNLAAWTNNLDVTAIVGSLPKAATSANFLFALGTALNLEATRDQVCFYSKDNKGIDAKADAAFAEVTTEQLKPVLTVTFVEDTDTSVKALQPSHDTWVMKGSNGTQGSAESMELYTTHGGTNKDGVDEEGRQLYGIMSFQLPAELASGNYDVTAATLRLTTTYCQGTTGISIYAYANDLDESSANFTSEEQHINNALENNAVATFNANGHSGKAIFDNGLADNYLDVANWQNTIDLTNHIQGKSGRINLLLAKTETQEYGQNRAVKFATKEAQDIVNKNYEPRARSEANPLVFAKEDLVPQLTVEYTKNGNTSAISCIATDDTAAEYYTLQGVRVAAPAPGHIYIVRQGNKASKVRF